MLSHNPLDQAIRSKSKQTRCNPRQPSQRSPHNKTRAEDWRMQWRPGSGPSEWELDMPHSQIGAHELGHRQDA